VHYKSRSTVGSN